MEHVISCFRHIFALFYIVAFSCKNGFAGCSLCGQEGDHDHLTCEQEAPSER